MKLDASLVRYLEKEDFRILSALEIGSKNHEVVPLTMLASLCRMRPGGVRARLSELAKHRLVMHEGYRLTYGGYDYLALHALLMRGSVEGVGRQIGVGKEADIYLALGRYPTGKALQKSTPSKGEEFESEELPLENFVLKIERLGRTSFRSVKTNRDYVEKRKHISWMYLSRLAAQKEWTFMKALHQHAFPTPKPVDWSRHCVVMEYIGGAQLEHIHPEDWCVQDPKELLSIIQYLFDTLMQLLVRLAEHGLIHGDFNEFNLLVKEEFLSNPGPFMHSEGQPLDANSSPVIIIDFPQMVSTSHPNAKELFDRDVNCLRTFFSRRFDYESVEWPDFERDVQPRLTEALDCALRASGFRGDDTGSESGSEEQEKGEECNDSCSDNENENCSDNENDSDNHSCNENENASSSLDRNVDNGQK